MKIEKYNRIWVIGDIHGCANALRILLKVMEPTQNDLIITLGDYVDRGPSSYEVLEILIHLHKQGILIPLRGNHEMLLLLNCYRKDGRQTWLDLKNKITMQSGQLFTSAKASNKELSMMKIKMASLTPLWKSNGSEATIKSYKHGNRSGLAIMPEHHFYFLERDCLDWYELNGFIFVHGAVETDEALENTDIQNLHWKRTDPVNERRHCSGKVIVCGHSVQSSGNPSVGDNCICLDTGACCGGWLSALDLKSGECWQSNENGQVRNRSYEKLPLIVRNNEE